MRRPAIGPVVIANSAASSVWEKGASSTSLSLHLLRERLRHATVSGWPSPVLPSEDAKGPAAPAGIVTLTSEVEPGQGAGGGRQAGRYLLTCSCRRFPPGDPASRAGSPMSAVATRRVCPRTMLPSAHARRASRARMICGPYERCSSMTSRRRGSPTVLPSACGKGCQQHQQVLHLWRALQRRVFVPVAIIGSAAIRVCERTSSTSGTCISYVRCGDMPLGRTWSPTVLPSTCAISASSTSRPYPSYE